VNYEIRRQEKNNSSDKEIRSSNKAEKEIKDQEDEKSDIKQGTGINNEFPSFPIFP
jgi:hypothetical protein